MIRALIVDDSAFMRRIITDILEGSGRVKVVGFSRNGSDVLQKCQRLQPDVVTMDVEMPVCDGLSALTELMREYPVPVVMLSSHTQQGTRTTFEALARGAVDFVSKPASPTELLDNTFQLDFIDKIVSAAAIDLRKLEPVTQEELPRRSSLPAGAKRTIVAIGTSTGGPRALQQLLSGLPADGLAAYLIVQHMPKGFTQSLAERLNSVSRLTVQEARDQQIVAPDNVYIAPGDAHLSLITRGGEERIALSYGPPVSNHRPSVDVLLSSVAQLKGIKRIGVILTGMGADGAKGVQALKASGGTILAEDASTAVINGMPRSAIATGCVDLVVPLTRMAASIMAELGS